MDVETLLRVARRVPRAVTIEENVIIGGFGAAVTLALTEHGCSIPCHQLGVPDRFIEHGARDILLRRLGLDAEGIASAVMAALSGDCFPSPSSPTPMERE